jgi:threonine/homoserine/homoserine lactone efflux protein
MGDNLLALTIFAFVGAFTPGPNNLMATAAGTAFGLARTISQILGVTFGFCVMIVAFGFGFAQVVAAFPTLHRMLQIVGAAYLLYLAWRIARAGDPAADEAMRRPLTFYEGAMFQLINPKAWTLVLGVVAAFTTGGDRLYLELAVIVAIFAFMTTATLVVWCLFGVAIRMFLSSPRQRRIVNYTMSAAVVLSVAMLFV